jgi:hypothetical protein
VNDVRIETFTLANHAESINDTLYLMGAGWTIMRRPLGAQPAPTVFGMGLSVLTPWSETNTSNKLAVWLEDEDGNEQIWRVDASMEVGRPPGSTHGADIRSVLALNNVFVFPRAGGYRAVAELNGDPETRKIYPFRVHDVVVPAA